MKHQPQHRWTLCLYNIRRECVSNRLTHRTFVFNRTVSAVATSRQSSLATARARTNHANERRERNTHLTTARAAPSPLSLHHPKIDDTANDDADPNTTARRPAPARAPAASPSPSSSSFTACDRHPRRPRSTAPCVIVGLVGLVVVTVPVAVLLVVVAICIVIIIIIIFIVTYVFEPTEARARTHRRAVVKRINQRTNERTPCRVVSCRVVSCRASSSSRVATHER